MSNLVSLNIHIWFCKIKVETLISFEGGPGQEERLPLIPAGQAWVWPQGPEGREAEGLPVHAGTEHTGMIVRHSGPELEI